MTPEVKKIVDSLSEEIGMSPADLASSLFVGLNKTWKDEGELTIPFRVVPEASYLKWKSWDKSK